MDVSGYGLTGRQAESALLDAGIVTNRNSIPRDPNGAWYTSGVRIGTPALTSRGFGAGRVRRGRLADRRRAVGDHSGRGQPGPSKAKYQLAAGVADKVHSASAELLAKHRSTRAST